MLVTDETKLVQILRNLVTNALKFTAEGEVVLRAHGDRGLVTFSVSDTGVGIAPEDLERVFEEFVQVPGEHQRNVRGTGLGLPLCRKLVSVLGGTIDVESTLGQGTTFTVRLPVAASPEPAAPEDDHDLLIVDDDEAARYVLRTHLRDSGWSVREASSGREALASVEEATPSAILLDLSMPDLDGLEVLERVRAMPGTGDVKIVIHSSRAIGEAERDACQRYHALLLDKAMTSRSSVLNMLAAAGPGGPDGG